jgi:hypothetical protein
VIHPRQNLFFGRWVEWMAWANGTGKSKGLRGRSGRDFSPLSLRFSSATVLFHPCRHTRAKSRAICPCQLLNPYPDKIFQE